MNIIKKYLDDVVQGKKQPNLQVIYNLQVFIMNKWYINGHNDRKCSIVYQILVLKK